ncbi:Hypothetical protein Ccan_17990 [Capnocytophaga canimorsus Cc5]|uniref:Uncharacterized protein n=1 Tax=Capnocytophaga canimorsus (strain 5) TaxID=860228 RepID=F9YSS0_CAPCC|nr:Hypothetical protein Ccan_17990 [Capnocytophaga canimorsus Cc5]CEN44328.1 conserved hypothetical protein [Capnocytophaga canimorsus]
MTLENNLLANVNFTMLWFKIQMSLNVNSNTKYSKMISAHYDAKINNHFLNLIFFS